ncbi:ABC transporter substrate-binding protein [Lusitaniella coriacea]|uniref:ABC transporter substrate-binding protein n=1 Tax=Lusitaniella coriacea TaxID=1983105 RepID=UPI003CF1656D
MSISQQIGKLKKRVQKRLKLPRLFILFLGAIAVLCFWVIPAFTQQPIPIKVFIQSLEGTQWEPIVRDFNQTHDNIRLEVIKGPNDTNLVEDLYTSAFLLGDSPYDLVYMDIVWVPKFAAAGWLMPLSDRISDAALSEYLQGDIEGGTYEGQLYRMPFRSDGGMLYYRTDMLEQAGLQPPKTFEELIQTAKTVKEKNIAEIGYVWQGKQYEGLSAMFVEILEGQGGYWVNPDTKEVGLDSKEAIQALEFLRDTIKTGISPEGVTTYAEEETRLLFESGKTLFLRNWPYVYPLASKSEIAGKFAIKPMIHSPGENSGACLGGWGPGISSSTKHPDEAWEVIEYLSQPDVQRKFFLETGYVPARKSLFTDPTLVAQYSYYPNLLDVVENSALRPPIAQYAQASDILQRYLSAAITGSLSPQQAMQAAARETRNLLGR